MTDIPVSLLIVDGDRDLAALLAREAGALGYRATCASSPAGALQLLQSDAFEAAVIDLRLGSESGLDVIPRIKQLAPDVEIVVTSATTSLASAIKSYDLAAFAFVQKPFDTGQLFATVERALERRRMNLQNRRLVWELQLLDFMRRGKREWEQTFDAISDPIAVFDNRGELLRGNTALAAHLGRAVTDIRHATCAEIGFCGGGCPACGVGRALAQDAGRAEITLADGQIFSVTTFPVGSEPHGAAVVQVAKNVTEEMRSARRLRQMSEELALANARLVAALDQLKSTQAQLLQSEKLSAIGQLVAGFAHELNNPLTSVIGYAQLLEDELLENRDHTEPRPAHELAHDMRRIAEESERAARIVRNLLAFARRQTAERVPQDVTDLFSRVLSLRAYELRLNSIDLRTEFEPGLPPVVADGGQLQQALLNLILNAEQAMRGRTVRRLVVAARLDAAASAVELSVSDSGHGIEATNVSRIFDPFFTTREVGEGTGLGLSICYGIVRDHGGQITVESNVQIGTTFSILLPGRVEDPAATPDEIVVAHADQGQRDFLSAALTGWGHRVATCATTADALSRCQRGGIRGLLIDRDLLAGDLPAWRTVRQGTTGAIPLILLSLASATDGDVERFARAQATAVVVPPFQLRALRMVVRAVSDPPPAGRAGVFKEYV